MQQQKIPVYKAVLMGINIMIGGGLLAGPGLMAKAAGNWSFIAWVIAGIAFIPVLFCLLRLSTRITAEGGLYAYVKHAFGYNLGFVAGWMYYVGYAIAACTLINSFRNFFLILNPDLWILVNKPVFMALAITVLLMLNLLRASLLANVISYLTLAKLSTPIIAIALSPLFWGRQLSFPLSDLAGFGSCMSFALFGFLGLEFSCNITHLVQGGASAGRRALLWTFGMVVVICTMFHLSLLYIMGAEGLAFYQAGGYGRFVAQVLPTVGGALQAFIPAFTLLAFFNSSNGLFSLACQLIANLVEDGQLQGSTWLAVQNSSQRPYRLVGITAILLYSIATFLPGLNLLADAAVMVINGVIFASMLALWKIESNQDAPMSMATKLMILAAKLVLATVMIMIWMGLGKSNYARLTAFLPVFIALAIGLLVKNWTSVRPNKAAA